MQSSSGATEGLRVFAIKGCLMGALILLMGLCGVWLVNGGKFGKNEKAELELSEAI